MEWRRGYVCIMGTILLVSACASTGTATPPPNPSSPPPPMVEAVTETASPIERLVIYADKLRALTPPALESERMTAEQDYRSAPTGFNRLRLALVLSQPRVPFRDDARARELLGQAVRDPSASSDALRSFAGWMLQELDDRAAAERMLEEERRQRLGLQKKLDQLKAVEEEMDRRSNPSVVTPR